MLARISQFAYNSSIPLSSPSISVTGNENRFPTNTGRRSRYGLDKEESMDQLKSFFKKGEF
jgi:hypothetical protein